MDKKSMEAMDRLLNIMARLRGEGGCPWDQEQDHQTLKKYLIEEAYEVIDAIEQENDDMLVEELGDLLLQIVFHSQIGKEEGRFEFSDVAESISEKMVRRHPHVFSPADFQAADADAVLVKWAEIKDTEKKKSLMDVPKPFPALYRSQKLQKNAARVGFDWDKSDDVRNKILEELAEVDAAIQGEGDIGEEMGDLLFAVVNWCRFYRVDAEEALRDSNEKFIRRFNLMEELITAEEQKMEEMSLEELDRFWEKAKKKIKGQ